MARIAVEQLVDAMDLDETWVQMNLSAATSDVRELAAQLVAEKSSRCDDGYLILAEMCSDFDAVQGEKLRLIPGSGY